MSKTRTVATGVAALAAVAALGACSNSATNQATSSSAPSSSAAPAGAHNQADMMFVHQMIPHHQQAIQMSDMILGKQGIDPQVADLAKQIKAAQGPEIEQMQGWMSQWGMPGTSGTPGMSGMPGDMPDHGGMQGPQEAPSGSPTTTMTTPSESMMPSGSMMPGMEGMEGMMSPADMQALQDAQGVDASKLFLQQMIKHHQGAITMAQKEINTGQYPPAIALARSIATSQQQEINTMQGILASL